MTAGRAGALFLLLAGCASLPYPADEIPGIVRVDEGYRSEADAHRLAQAFLGEPGDSETDVILRTDPASRVGYHFHVALASGLELPAGAKVRVQYVAKEGEAAVERTLPLPRRPGWWFGEVVIGLTGGDAPTPKWRPVAWRISVLGPDGKELAVRRSFLWGMPTDGGLGK